MIISLRLKLLFFWMIKLNGWFFFLFVCCFVTILEKKILFYFLLNAQRKYPEPKLASSNHVFFFLTNKLFIKKKTKWKYWKELQDVKSQNNDIFHFFVFFHNCIIVKLAANHWFDCFISVKPFQELLWLLCPPPAAPCEKQYKNANMELFIYIC